MLKLFNGDSSVQIGIVIAAPGVWLSHKFGDLYFDLGALVVIGLLLLGAVLVFITKSGGLLSGERIEQNLTAHSQETIAADPAVAVPVNWVPRSLRRESFQAANERRHAPYVNQRTEYQS
jgi:hypothetical protein